MTSQIEQLESVLANIPDNDFKIIYDYIINDNSSEENILTDETDVAIYNTKLGGRTVAIILNNIRNRALNKDKENDK